jgi:tRNA threonylcarbamoyladenosine biosynthesis protein TsaE
MDETVRTRSEEETREVARRLAVSLEPGAVVLLVGDLGSGKTTFVRGMAPALEIASDEICSPTFTLLQEYRGSRLTLYHADLYRIEGPEAEDLGLEDLPAASSVLVVEWAEKLPRPFPGAIRVTIADLGGDEREITIERTEPRVQSPNPRAYSD